MTSRKMAKGRRLEGDPSAPSPRGETRHPLRYDRIGRTYSHYRRPDPRIQAGIEAALAGARSVVDVGSGTGSYEPSAERVVAVEPSVTMIRQRPQGTAPVVRAVAERLPFPDDAFDAAMALLTVHHWVDPARGLAELVRVAPRQVVLTWDPEVYSRFWLFTEYLPEVPAMEADLPTVSAVTKALGVAEVIAVPVPWDCTDGFCGAYWRRPSMYLHPDARAAISAFSGCPPEAVARAVACLERDLEDGAWDRRHEDLVERSELDLGYRIVVGSRGGASFQA